MPPRYFSNKCRESLFCDLKDFPERRNHCISVKLTRTERSFIERVTRECGVPISEFVRRNCLEVDLYGK